MLIDTHCHLNFKDFKKDADKVIRRSLANGVQLINVGSELRTSQRAIEYAEKYENGVWAAVGLHPIHVNSEQGVVSKEQYKKEEFNYQKYLKLAKNEKVIAIGEVGLDYHHFDTSKYLSGKIEGIIEKQKEVLREFIKLAKEVNKPLALHCWGADKKDKSFVDGADAYDDLLRILMENLIAKSGVIHSFIGGYRMAQKFIDVGFLIGLNGIITYSESYDKLIKKIGLENIILETDAPYLTPVPLGRYSRNEPMSVMLVAQKIADVLKIDIEEVEMRTTENAREMFNL